MYEFKLPDLGEGIHEGEILKWHVSPGDPIQEDAPLVDVETDKAAVTIPSPVGGRIASLGGKPGDVVAVGAVLAVIVPADEAAGASAPAAAEAVAPTVGAPTAQAGPSPVAPAARRRPVPAAPATRRLARELGVDLAAVVGSGPAGRVTADDVKLYYAGLRAQADEPAGARAGASLGAPPAPLVLAPPPEPRTTAAPATERAPRTAEAEFAAHAASAIPFLDIEPLPDFAAQGPVEREPLRSIRRRVAHKMTTSKILVPHVAHMDDADVTLLEAFRKREKERRKGTPGGKLTLLAFVVKAVTAGLRAAPSFNASLDPFREEIVYKKYYNLGIAADTGRGLVVPVIKDTDRKSIIQISAEIEALVERARAGALGADDFKAGTFTITNVGPLGGTALIPAINYPEVAILGMGRVQQKPVVRDGEIVVRDILPLTLAFDHRVADGADAARFVAELVRQLSDPNLLLLET